MFLRLLRHLEKYLQTLIKFNFKIIFVFSDPAGGNIITSLIDNLLLKDKIPEVDFKVFSNLEGIIDKSYEKYIIRIPNNLNLIQDEILRFKPEKYLQQLPIITLNIIGEKLQKNKYTSKILCRSLDWYKKEI